jgi:hypothetical protein
VAVLAGPLTCVSCSVQEPGPRCSLPEGVVTSTRATVTDALQECREAVSSKQQYWVGMAVAQRSATRGVVTSTRATATDALRVPCGQQAFSKTRRRDGKDSISRGMDSVVTSTRATVTDALRMPTVQQVVSNTHRL